MGDDRSRAMKVAGGVGTLLIIPAVLAYITNQYTSAMKEREIQAQYVKLAVDILQAEPTEANRSVRTWATKIIDKYSGIPLGVEAEKALIETVPISPRVGGRFWAAPTPQELTKVQAMLKKLGFYKGDLDGDGGQETIQAVTEFQKSAGLIPDGILGAMTLETLRTRAGEGQK
jgi:putative peptidoglycan binding protein